MSAQCPVCPIADIIAAFRHFRKVPTPDIGVGSFKGTSWPDLWWSHRFRHAEEDDHALAAATCGDSFGRDAETAINILPVVHDPNIARRSDCKIGLHL